LYASYLGQEAIEILKFCESRNKADFTDLHTSWYVCVEHAWNMRESMHMHMCIYVGCMCLSKQPWEMIEPQQSITHIHALTFRDEPGTIAGGSVREETQENMTHGIVSNILIFFTNFA